MKGIATLAILPVKAAPSHQSELVSQLLFGEHYTILEEQAPWLYIRMEYDGYEGWLHEQQHTPYADEAPQTPEIVDLSMHNFLLQIGQESALHILPGSSLPGLNGEQLSIAAQDYLYLGMSRQPTQEDFETQIVEATEFYLNTPYLWGGRSAYGIDCSGLTQMVYKYFNIPLKRDASLQAEQGKVVKRLEDAQAGDLAFFDSGENRVTHVGVLLNASEIIHAYGRVRQDRVDSKGILQVENGTYSHNLRGIRRML